MDINSIGWEWVVGRYTGDRARSVKSHADNGIGYFVRQERGKANSYELEVAFRRVIDGPRPEHLMIADTYQAQKLDDLYAQRHGLRDNQPGRVALSSGSSDIGKAIRQSGLKAAYEKMRAERRVAQA